MNGWFNWLTFNKFHCSIQIKFFLLFFFICCVVVFDFLFFYYYFFSPIFLYCFSRERKHKFQVNKQTNKKYEHAKKSRLESTFGDILIAFQTKVIAQNWWRLLSFASKIKSKTNNLSKIRKKKSTKT